MSSVCPSVCSLSLCDVGGSGSHRLEILETNCAVNYHNSFALRNLKAIHLLTGEHGEIWGRLEVGWEKVACWSTKAAKSLKCVKIEEKLLWSAYIGTHKHSFERYHATSRPSMASSSLRLEVRKPPPKASIAIISGTGKATDFKFGRYIYRVHPNKSPLKGVWAYPGTAPIFGDTPIISRMGKAVNFKFVHTFTGSIGTKAHEKIQKK